MYKLLYHPDVPKKDLPKISHPNRERIRRAIESKLMTFPLKFGEPLQRNLRGCRKLRVGMYRVIYEVRGDTVFIWKIGHRREVYDDVRF